MNHASRRALSRYGLEMTMTEQNQICGSILRGEGGRILNRCKPGDEKAEFWVVFWPRLGRFIPVIFLRATSSLATVMPASTITKRKRLRELDADWIEDESEAFEFDADALADVLVNALRGDVANDVLAVKLKEAGVAL